MSSAGRSGSRYHRENLRDDLLAHGIELARGGGPDAVSLRDVQRRAGVSNSAAYRHYADRDALLAAISRHASAQMARRMELAIGNTAPAATAADTARARLRATGRAYLEFALTEPGLFAVAFLAGDTAHDKSDPPPEARGESGLGPFQLLVRCVDDLVSCGVLAPAHRAFTDIVAWSAVHGLATLLLDGPLKTLDERERQAAIERMLDIVSAGIS